VASSQIVKIGQIVNKIRDCQDAFIQLHLSQTVRFHQFTFECNAAQVADGVFACVRALRKLFPTSNILQVLLFRTQ
jgi:hypothetical protein